eukprot:TRINITY_DN3265_c0_g1_i4.p1 TRINITY_DN3265_c0_g1~~TRINITY_DN3265_c0_g1_i4.p1  ORF type:complete len:503 (+),score=127.77 TRINITY_DN3265_c0_g1_i4:200-1708(+)
MCIRDRYQRRVRGAQVKMMVRFVFLLGLAAATPVSNVGVLPGLPQKQCWESSSGYLPVNGKSLFHWYHESTSSAETKPVVLWLNGGPGCSSLGGMFTENGPYVLDAEQQISFNPYSWNKPANMLYIEQPAGVGFSHPAAPTNDSVTAADTYGALIKFFAAHPELEGRKFYIAGESYGGHYIPNTAAAILEGNKALPAGSKDKINLIGFAVGNGYTDWQLDFNANVQNGRFHALCSQELYDAADKACGGDYARCFWPNPNYECPEPCKSAVANATVFAQDGSIDIYDIYEDVCLQKGQKRRPTQMFRLMEERRNRLVEHTDDSVGGTTISPIFATCIDNYAADYLNRVDVQSAIGVDPSSVPGGEWRDCGLEGNYSFNYESELPKYKSWVADGSLQILIYNGDADYILSHMGNSAWIREGLGLVPAEGWTMWKGSDRQVAGYFETYNTAGKSLTFLTVKGAGHMVPKDRPRHALDMFTQFLEGTGYDKVPTDPTPAPLCPSQF